MGRRFASLATVFRCFEFSGESFICFSVEVVDQFRGSLEVFKFFWLPIKSQCISKMMYRMDAGCLTHEHEWCGAGCSRGDPPLEYHGYCTV